MGRGGGSEITELQDLNYKGKRVDVCKPEKHDIHRNSFISALVPYHSPCEVGYYVLEVYTDT